MAETWFPFSYHHAEVADVGEWTRFPALGTGLFGQSLQTSQSYAFTVEEAEQTTESIELINPDSEEHSATLEVVNPHADLTVSLAETTVTVAPGETKDVSLSLNAGTIPLGVFEDILLEVAVDDGSTLYSNIIVYVTDPAAPDRPDLAVSSGDIGLTSGDAGDPDTLTATVHNGGTAPVSNVEVEFYEFDTLLGSAIIDAIAAGETGSASIEVPALTEGDHLIRVVVDPTDAIEELDEANNEASQIVRPAGTPGPAAGSILVTGSLPSTVYTDALFSLTGQAVYDITIDGVRYTNYVVKGGSMEVTIRAEDGTEWVYGGIHTDANGYFTKALLAPSTPGTYQLFMTVTDNTFIGTRELVFTVAERPATPPPPPSPPILPTSGGTGEWTFDGVDWNWTWTTPPTSGPVPVTDVRVFSEDIHFSKNNPDAEEEITVFAEIHYWAMSTALVAEDIPVNIYATLPGSEKELIGKTLIPSLSVAAPENGTRYVYATWKNPGEGIYITEVEIDPSWVEENMLNNAATRAIIVGELAPNQGAISGQVTDAWGGVGNVMVSVFDVADQLIGSTFTDDTGFYLLESIPASAVEVRIDTPEGYMADAEAKLADVVTQSVTEVDFYLTEEVDTEPPVLTLPADITVEATGPSGAVVSYEATATDAVDGDLTPTCTPESGSTFALGITLVTCTATDSADNTASGSFNVTVVDTTPPTVTVPSDITEEAIGPSGAAVSFTATATDAVDGDLTPTCAPASGSTFPLGTTTVTCTATDAAGNSADASFNVRVVDTMAPTITAAATSSPDGNNGWYRSNVTVQFTCSDAGSGIAPGACPADEVLSAEGSAVSSTARTVTDRAGNTSAPSNLVTVSIDKTPPTIIGSTSPAPNGNGWNNSPVTVSFDCDDATSGVADCAAIRLLVEGANQSVSGTGVDVAGNTANTQLSGINIDLTPPEVSVTGVSDGATYTLGSVPAVGCTTTDALSGVQADATASVTGGNGDGTGTFTASCAGAMDKAGNAGEATVTYLVTSAPPVSGFPTNPVLDDFNRRNGRVGNNWALGKSLFQYKIVNNSLDVRLGGALIWKPDSFSASQEAFVTLTKVAPHSPTQGLLLKAQADNRMDAGVIVVVYDARAEAVRVSTLRLDQPAWTNYGNTEAAFSDGDQLGARVLADGTVEVYQNGTLVETVTLTAEDQVFFNSKGGRIGIWTLAAPTAVLDDFGGGDFTP